MIHANARDEARIIMFPKCGVFCPSKYLRFLKTGLEETFCEQYLICICFEGLVIIFL